MIDNEGEPVESTRSFWLSTTVLCVSSFLLTPYLTALRAAAPKAIGCKTGAVLQHHTL
jgi:hypothetical protein